MTRAAPRCRTRKTWNDVVRSGRPVARRSAGRRARRRVEQQRVVREARFGASVRSSARRPAASALEPDRPGPPQRLQVAARWTSVRFYTQADRGSWHPVVAVFLLGRCRLDNRLLHVEIARRSLRHAPFSSSRPQARPAAILPNSRPATSAARAVPGGNQLFAEHARQRLEIYRITAAGSPSDAEVPVGSSRCRSPTDQRRGHTEAGRQFLSDA